MKRAFSMILALVMVLSLCSVMGVSALAEGEQTKGALTIVVTGGTGDAIGGDGLGFASAAALRDSYDDDAVLLVDAGGFAVNAAAIMTAAGYDLVVPDEALTDWDIASISMGVSGLSAGVMFEKNGVRVAFVGVVPMSVPAGEPAAESAEEAAAAEPDAETYFANIQAAVTAARDKGAAYVIALGLVEDAAALTENVTGIDAVVTYGKAAVENVEEPAAESVEEEPAAETEEPAAETEEEPAEETEEEPVEETEEEPAVETEGESAAENALDGAAEEAEAPGALVLTVGEGFASIGVLSITEDGVSAENLDAEQFEALELEQSDVILAMEAAFQSEGADEESGEEADETESGEEAGEAEPGEEAEQTEQTADTEETTGDAPAAENDTEEADAAQEQPAEEEKSAEEPAAAEEPAEQPVEEQPAEEPAEEKPAEEQPAEEQSAEEPAAAEEPVSEPIEEDKPVEEQAAEQAAEQPAAEEVPAETEVDPVEPTPVVDTEEAAADAAAEETAKPESEEAAQPTRTVKDFSKGPDDLKLDFDDPIASVSVPDGTGGLKEFLSDYYTLSGDSKSIAIRASVLNDWPEATYSFTFHFSNGAADKEIFVKVSGTYSAPPTATPEATATAAPTATPEATATPAPTPTPTPTPKANGTPATGDNSPIVTYAVILVVLLAALAVVVVLVVRKNKRTRAD